jgi:hypothetical protein
MMLLGKRFACFLRFFFSGWDYESWDPPYPGDGI